MTESATKESSHAGVRVLLWCGLAAVIGVAALSGARSLLGSRSSAAMHAGPSTAGASGVLPSAGRPAAAGAPEVALGALAPSFSLTDRSGRTVTADGLHGKVWIANFIFTRCATICPTLTREMLQIRDRLSEKGAGDVVSVSFSIDPGYDSPEVLTKYAQEHRADRTDWLFLTGEPATMLHVVKDGFHLMMSDPAEGPPMHSNRFLVVDAQGRVRSSRLGTEEGVVEALVNDCLAIRGGPRL